MLADARKRSVTTWPFLVDALSFLASAVCLALVRTRFGEEEPTGPRKALRRDIADGVRWLWRQPVLRLVIAMAAGLQIAISGIGLVAIVIARDSGAAPATIGVLFSALGAGGVVGSLLAPGLQRLLGPGPLLLSVLWGQGLVWLVVAYAGHLVVVGVALAFFAVTMPCFGIVALSYQLRVTPDHLRGRVSTTFQLLIWAATPAGAALAGLLLDTTSARVAALGFAGWVLVLSAASTVLLRHRLDRLAPADV